MCFILEHGQSCDQKMSAQSNQKMVFKMIGSPKLLLFIFGMRNLTAWRSTVLRTA